MDLRINETFQTGAVRKTKLPFCRLVGTVFNSADAVRLETTPTGGKSLFIFRIHHNCPFSSGGSTDTCACALHVKASELIVPHQACGKLHRLLFGHIALCDLTLKGAANLVTRLNRVSH